MIVEKPAWVQHDGAIFSMDLQPIGHRCATAGVDNKVKLWNTEPLCRNGELDAATPMLLATLCDHCGPVNCVRWSNSGLYIASGSDDKLVLIYEMKPGAGTAEFGSGQPANVENWKVISQLRGHTGDVVDLAWSPDDTMLASCSMDNTVRVWQMTGGHLISVLTGHTSLVKGVAWDPIGTFLASQSDDKTVIIWQTGNWTPVHKAEGPWRKTVGSTFFRRLAWSPCGHFIITTHGFQKPRHTAQVLERGDWSAAFNFVGHTAPVVAVRVNRCMFRKVAPASDNGDPKKAQKELDPYSVIAIGSQDCNVTVWSTANARPVFVGKHFFQQSVVDLTWSQDGYSLFCCSSDGTIATFHFDVDELGHKVPEKELEEFKKRRYGDMRTRKGSLAESPAQLLLEESAAKKPSTAVASSAPPKASLPVNEATVPSTLPPPPPPPPPAVSKPVRQKEYIQRDGRRRIIPEPLPNEEGPPANGFPNDEVLAAEPGEKRKLASEDLPSKRLSTESMRATEVSVGRGMASAATAAVFDIAGGALSVQVTLPEAENGAATGPLCLEAKLNSGESDLVCSQAGETKWRDRLAGKVTALTGNSNFWAIGCEDGSLQVYSMAGRRVLPRMFVGSAAAFMDCNEDWELLMLTRGGTMHVWDLHQPACILNESLHPLLSTSLGNAAKEAGVMKVMSARFSQSGAPLVVMANGHAFLFHVKLRSWIRVADDTFPGSSFLSTWPPVQANTEGELTTLQKGAAMLGRSTFTWGRALVNEKYQTRAHLEDQIASALALTSADEYRHSLVAYVRFLAREADEVRLREICEDFLGPLHDTSGRWDPSVIGMDKREILRRDILPAMASNRAVQRLLNEYLDLLTEYEIRCKPAQEDAAAAQEQAAAAEEEPKAEALEKADVNLLPAPLT